MGNKMYTTTMNSHTCITYPNGSKVLIERDGRTTIRQKDKMDVIIHLSQDQINKMIYQWVPIEEIIENKLKHVFY